jgi:hypothetical protein
METIARYLVPLALVPQLAASHDDCTAEATVFPGTYPLTLVDTYPGDSQAPYTAQDTLILADIPFRVVVRDEDLLHGKCSGDDDSGGGEEGPAGTVTVCVESVLPGVWSSDWTLIGRGNLVTEHGVEQPELLGQDGALYRPPTDLTCGETVTDNLHVVVQDASTGPQKDPGAIRVQFDITITKNVLTGLLTITALKVQEQAPPPNAQEQCSTTGIPICCLYNGVGPGGTQPIDPPGNPFLYPAQGMLSGEVRTLVFTGTDQDSLQVFCGEDDSTCAAAATATIDDSLEVLWTVEPSTAATFVFNEGPGLEHIAIGQTVFLKADPPTPAS